MLDFAIKNCPDGSDVANYLAQRVHPHMDKKARTRATLLTLSSVQLFKRAALPSGRGSPLHYIFSDGKDFEGAQAAFFLNVDMLGFECGLLEEELASRQHGLYVVADAHIKCALVRREDARLAPLKDAHHGATK